MAAARPFISVVLRSEAVLRSGGTNEGSPARLLAGLLFGVAPRDPGILAAASAALALAGCAAVILPAVRATRIDPVRALRAE